MAGEIVGMNGQVLRSKETEDLAPDVALDFFFPADKKDDPRIQVLGHLAQAIIQMSMEAGIGEFCMRFRNEVIRKKLTVAVSGRADISFVASSDPTYLAFSEMALPIQQPLIEESEGDDE